MLVKEGNRRITCLKLLKNPNILPDDFSLLRDVFKDLKKQTNKELFNNIPARIFNEDEDEDLELWIELRHSGLQAGKGLDKWGAIEKEKWQKYRGKNTPLLDFQKQLIDSDILTKDQVNSVNKTNWERILGTVGRSFLGIKYENGQYLIDINQEDFKNRIRITIKNLKGKSVGVVYDNDSIEDFFYGLNFNKDYEELNITSNDVKPKILDVTSSNVKPGKNKDSIKGEELIKNDNKERYKEDSIDIDRDKNIFNTRENFNYKDEKKTFNSTGIEKKRRRSTKPADFMGNLVCDLKSSQDTDGIIRLSIELKNMSKTKDYKEYPIAAAMLMRNLLEQCLIYYLKRRNKWEKFRKSRKYGPTLSEIIKKYNTDTDILKQDIQLERIFNILTETPGVKDYFDLIVHHPHKIVANPNCLDIIVQSGYLALVQHIIDY